MDKDNLNEQSLDRNGSLNGEYQHLNELTSGREEQSMSSGSASHESVEGEKLNPEVQDKDGLSQNPSEFSEDGAKLKAEEEKKKFEVMLPEGVYYPQFSKEKDFFARIAYRRGIESQRNFDEVKENLFQALAKQRNGAIEILESSREKEIARIINLIEEKQEEVKTLKEEIKEYSKQGEETENRLKEAELKLQEITKELEATFVELQGKVDRLIPVQAEKLSQVLVELKNRYRKIFEDEKDSLATRGGAQALGNLVNKLKDRYERIQTLFDELDLAGINPNLYNLLVYIGYFLAITSGWFFAGYVTYINNLSEEGPIGLGTQDYVSFVLRRILLFSGPNQDPSGWFILTQFGIYMGFLVFIAILSWFTQRQIEKNQMRLLTIDEGNPNIEPEEVLSKKLESERNNFYIAWLQVLPVLALTGGIIILITFRGITGDELDDLDSSLSGLTIGSAIAIGLAGIAYLYIIKVIEPRIRRLYKDRQKEFGQQSEQKGKNSKDSSPTRTKVYWEIQWMLGIFLASIIMLAFIGFFAKDTYGPINSILLLTTYGCIALISAFILAYGLRYRGLHIVEKSLEGQLLFYSLHFEQISSPSLSSPITIEGKYYHQGLREFFWGIVGMIKQENAILYRFLRRENDFFKKRESENENQALIPIQVSMKRQPSGTSTQDNMEEGKEVEGQREEPSAGSQAHSGTNSFLSFIQNIPRIIYRQKKQSRKGRQQHTQKEKEEERFIQLDAMLNDLFSGEKFKITELEKKREYWEVQLNKLAREAENFRNGTTEYERVRKVRIRSLEDSISSQEKNKIAYLNGYQKEILKVEDAYLKYTSEVEEGLNLAKWMIAYKAIPDNLTP